MPTSATRNALLLVVAVLAVESGACAVATSTPDADTDVADATDGGDADAPDVADTDAADTPSDTVLDTSVPDDADDADSEEVSDAGDVPDTIDATDAADTTEATDTGDVADGTDTADALDVLDATDDSDVADTGEDIADIDLDACSDPCVIGHRRCDGATIQLCTFTIACPMYQVIRNCADEGGLVCGAVPSGLDCVTSSCTDRVRGGDETDVDCGGSCEPCPIGDACESPDDCVSGICTGLVCSEPGCGDGLQNGAETGVDCGGDCGGCGPGGGCFVGDDCLSRVCGVDLRCTEARCDDRMWNGDETDVDCGGSCGPCGDGDACAIGEDCTSGVCSEGACAVPVCGDSVVNRAEEACDDGPANADDVPDACRTSCALAACGDAVVDTGEDCDDANADETDACLSTCDAASCGDGHVRAGVESCDDGNAASTDACIACTPARCGDGHVWSGVEGCDDGALVPYDGCSATCQPDTCPDVVVAAGSEFGAGVVTGDTCSASDSDPPPSCAPATAAPDTAIRYVAPSTGIFEFSLDNATTAFDAAIYAEVTCGGAESLCDATAGGPSVVTLLDEGEGLVLWVTGRTTGACGPFALDVVARYCGDGIIDGDFGEVCDDGNRVDTDDCTNACQPAVCGDGSVHEGLEECDDGPANSDTARDACRTSCLFPSCGDGVLDTGEACDDANFDNADACTNTCVVTDCSDRMQNRDEEGIDCGGDCPHICVETWVGPRTDLRRDAIPGWTLCYTSPYSSSGTTWRSVYEACVVLGPRGSAPDVMMACYQSGSPTFTVAAHGEGEQVFYESGAFEHEENGVDWYFEPGLAFGFVPLDAPLSRPGFGECDTSNGADGDQRMCLGGRRGPGVNEIAPGVRCGATFTTGGDWHRVFYREVSDTRTLCGNGTRDAGEACDDGNGNDADACPNDCTP